MKYFTSKDIPLIIEFDRELERVISLNQALRYSLSIQKKPFKFSEESKKLIIKNVIEAIKNER